MIVKCRCGASYNNKTVAHCPLCKPLLIDKIDNEDLKSLTQSERDRYFALRRNGNKVLAEVKKTEVEKFLIEDHMDKGKKVNSYRKSSRALWETQHRQTAKPDQFRGWR